MLVLRFLSAANIRNMVRFGIKTGWSLATGFAYDGVNVKTWLLNGDNAGRDAGTTVSGCDPHGILSGHPDMRAPYYRRPCQSVIF